MPSSTTTPDSPYAEIHDDEKGSTCAGLLLRAAEFLAANGIPRIERVLSDNAYTYRKSIAFKEAVAQIGAEQRFIKPHCPGLTARSNASTAPSPPSGPSGRSSPATKPFTTPLHSG